MSLPASVTGTKKQKKFFDSKGEADEYIQQLVETSPIKGTAAFSIENKLAHEAQVLMEKLKPHGVSLTDAVMFYIRHAPKVAGLKVSDVMDEYLATKGDETDDYRKNQAATLGVFTSEFGNKLIAGISAMPNQLRQWLDKTAKKRKWSDLNKRNYMRDISMFFNFCVKRDYCATNPMDKLDRPTVNVGNPVIYSIDECEKLLKVAKETDSELHLFNYFAFAFFTGIRVEELGGVTWEMVRWNQKEIHLPATITKTSRPRLIPIFDALTRWVTSPGSSGFIVSPVNLRNRKDALYEKAGLTKKRNAIRHCFASYHAACFRNFDELQSMLGQQTQSVLFKHYVASIGVEEAKRFFALAPKAAI